MQTLHLMENITINGNPSKPLENERFQQPGRRVPGREAMRPPAARPEITMHTLEIIGKMNVFSCPGSCNTVRSAESLCAAWEILWLLENLENRWKNMLFACVAETFPTGTYGMSRELSRRNGMVPAGEAQEKRESQRYHEWQRRSQQRAQCAPAAATNTPFLAKRNSEIKNKP